MSAPDLLTNERRTRIMRSVAEAARRPVDNYDAGNHAAHTFAFESDLDLIARYVVDLAQMALGNNQRCNYPARVAEDSTEMSRLALLIPSLQCSEMEKQKYAHYLGKLRDILGLLEDVRVPETAFGGFRGRVRAAFTFLEHEYGYHVGHESPAHVEYQSDAVWISIGVDEENPADGIAFGLREKKDERLFTLDDLLDFFEIRTNGSERFDLRTVPGVSGFIEVAARLFRRAHGVLTADVLAFKRLAALQDARNGTGALR